MENKELQIVLTAGTDNPTMAILALETAMVSVASGVKTWLFFTQRATQWTCKAARERGYMPRVLDLLDSGLLSGVNVEACSACIEKYCLIEGPETVQAFLRPDVEPSGLAVLVSRAVRGMPTLTF
ncbi:MAG: DsrE family protein [Planctomycetota bacterium]